MTLRCGMAFCLLLAAVGCGSSDSGATATTSPTPSVGEIIVSGSTVVEAGKTIPLTATILGSDGRPLSGKTITWASSNQAVATVAADGTVTGVGAGSAVISAKADAVTGQLPITVTVSVASLTITGTTAVQAGQTTKLTAVPKDANGNIITSVPVFWSSSDTTNANMTVASDGTVNAIHITTATITATAGSVSATATVTSSLSPYTFTFPNVTTAADQQLIKDAVQFAHGFYLATFGRTVQQPTSITTLGPGPTGPCAAGGAAAATTAGSSIFCTSNIGWTTFGPTLKGKIVMHELFHIWQFEAKWIGGPVASPTWLVEGSAEMMGFRATAARNLLPYPTAIGCQVKQQSDVSQQMLPGVFPPPLNTLETQQAFQTIPGPLYTISMLGTDQLVTTPGVTALKVYGDALGAGTAWPTAFQTAFGTTNTAFYAQFPTYLGSLTVPPTYLCQGL